VRCAGCWPKAVPATLSATKTEKHFMTEPFRVGEMRPREVQGRED